MSKVLDCVHLSNPRQIKEVKFLYFDILVHQSYTLFSGLRHNIIIDVGHNFPVFMQGPVLNGAWWVHQLWTVKCPRCIRKLQVLQISSETFSPDGANREQDILAIQVFCESMISFHTPLSDLIPFYCSTQKEAKEIMREAKEAGLTKQTYVWIVTQPVIGSDLDLAPQEFTEGMLGVHFDTSSAAMVREIDTGLTIFSNMCRCARLTRQWRCLVTPSTPFTLTGGFPAGQSRPWCRGYIATFDYVIENHEP